MVTFGQESLAALDAKAVQKLPIHSKIGRARRPPVDAGTPTDKSVVVIRQRLESIVVRLLLHNNFG
jgi:hypothetical protein